MLQNRSCHSNIIGDPSQTAFRNQHAHLLPIAYLSVTPIGPIHKLICAMLVLIASLKRAPFVLSS